jgi:hypothetical protein
MQLGALHGCCGKKVHTSQRPRLPSGLSEAKPEACGAGQWWEPSNMTGRRPPNTVFSGDRSRPVSRDTMPKPSPSASTQSSRMLLQRSLGSRIDFSIVGALRR